MDVLIIGGALAASFVGAFYLQKAALEAFLKSVFHE